MGMFALTFLTITSFLATHDMKRLMHETRYDFTCMQIAEFFILLPGFLHLSNFSTDVLTVVDKSALTRERMP